MQHPPSTPRVHRTTANIDTDTNTHGTRTRSFNLNEFNDLVSTALDMQRPLDSSLAFTVKATANARLPHTRHATSDPNYPSKAFRTLKNAIRRKGAAEDASERGSATRRPQLTRISVMRFASSSVPALPPTIGFSGDIPCSPSLTHIDEYDSDFNPVTDSSPSYPISPAVPSLHRAFPLEPWLEHGVSVREPYRKPAEILPDMPASEIDHQVNLPRERTRTKSTHKKFFKSLPFPKLKRKTSRLLFTSGSPPSPNTPDTPPDIPTSQDVEHSQSECDGMKSFFDDSGFEEDLQSLKLVRKVKSRPRIKHFFSAPPAVPYGSPGVQYRASKPLPPTPTTPSLEPQTKREGLQITQIPLSSEPSLESKETCLENYRHEYASPFYAPPSLPHRPAPRPSISSREKANKENATLKPRPVNVRERSPFDRLSRSMDLVRVPMRIKVRHSPSPYPSPTSPLPPTPDILPTQLTSNASTRSLIPNTGEQDLSENMSCESADQSVDSVEILSWRTKGLQKRSSKTSSGSAHARGMPSRNSIRERFGLGPQLYIHVSEPEVSQPQPIAHDIQDDPYVRTRTISALTLRPPSRVNTSGEVLAERAVASMSMQPLQNGFKNSDGVTSDTCISGGCFEAFGLEDDPFAAGPLLTPPVIPTPPSPADVQSISPSMRLRSFMPLGNDSKPSSLCAPDSTNLWSSFLRPRRSSPSLATSATSTYNSYPAQSSPADGSRIASPSSIRSGLPPSLVDALGPRVCTPTPSSSPKRPHLSLNLNQMLLRSKGMQRLRKDSVLSKSSYVSEGSTSGGLPRVAGHSDSRPHSPFPLLFFKSGTNKLPPIVNAEQSTCTTSSSSSEPKSSNGSSEVQTPTTPTFPVQGLQAIGARDADAFGDACKRYSEVSMLLPPELTNSLPAFDRLDEEPVDELDAEQTDGLSLSVLGVEEVDVTVANAEDAEDIGANDEVKDDDGTEKGGETDNEEARASKQVWPLPPLRTVVLDEESGEGWHEVDEIIEHVPLHATVPDAPRHTIRLPFGSNRSNSTKSSSSGSGKSRRLGADQARKIIETLNSSSEQPRSPTSHSFPPDYKSSRYHRKSLSIDSDLSFLSTDTGSQSVKTCASAYYSVQSSHSFRLKNPHKSAAQRRLDTSTLSGPTPSSWKRDRSGSYGSSIASGSAASTMVCIAKKKVQPDALPRSVSLCDDPNMNTMSITTDGWDRLMAFCDQNEKFAIGAMNDLTMLWVSIEEVILPLERADYCLPGIPGGLSSTDIHVHMTLTLNAPKQEFKDRDTPVKTRSPDLTFCLPLPTTLGEIAEYSRRSSIGEDFSHVQF